MKARPVAVILAALVPAGVLVMDPAGLAPYAPSKWLAVTTVALAGVAAVARSRGVQVVRGPTAAWLAFLVLVAIAAGLGVDGLYAWTGTPERHFGFVAWALCALAFVAGQTVDDEGDARLLIGVTVGTAALLGAVALAEAVGWELVTLDASQDRLLATMGSAAYLGAASALLVPIAVGVAVDASWSRRARMAAAGATLLSGVALVGSGARAAWVGLAAAAVLVAWARRQVIGRHMRAALAAAITVAAVVAVGAWALGVSDRVTDGGTSRLDEWRVALRVVRDHPLTGVGPEGYRIAFADGVDRSYQREHGRSPLPDRAHDSLLDVAVTAGLPGLLAYAALLVAAGRLVLRALWRGPPWMAGAAAGLVAYTAQSLFLFPLAELEPAVWLLAGMIVAHHARPDERLRFELPRGAAVGTGAVAVGFAVAGCLDVAADRSAKAALGALDERRPAAASRHAERSVDLRPDVLRYRLAAARAHQADGSREGFEDALADLAAAARLSRRDPVVRSERARLLVDAASRSGSPTDVRAARSFLTQAVADDPLDPELQLRLGVAAALGGDDAAAERAWRAAEELAPESAAAPANLATTYARQKRWADAEAAAHRALAREPANVRAQAVLEQIASSRGT